MYMGIWFCYFSQRGNVSKVSAEFSGVQGLEDFFYISEIQKSSLLKYVLSYSVSLG